MPHDKFGRELKVGDKVSLTGTVASIDTQEETFCNFTFHSDEGMSPDSPPIGIALSARMVVISNLPSDEEMALECLKGLRLLGFETKQQEDGSYLVSKHE